MSKVLRYVIVDIDHPRAVEDVAGRPKWLRDLRQSAEIKQGAEGEKHAPPFVGNRRSTIAAAELARENVPRLAGSGVVEEDLLHAAGESNICLFKCTLWLVAGAILRGL